VAVARQALADDLAVSTSSAANRGGGAVALVVVGHRAGATFLIGSEAWVRSSAWIWDFPSAQHDGLLGRIEVQADDVDELVLEVALNAVTAELALRNVATGAVNSVSAVASTATPTASTTAADVPPAQRRGAPSSR
jgi:hypothetical protein